MFLTKKKTVTKRVREFIEKKNWTKIMIKQTKRNGIAFQIFITTFIFIVE